MGWNDWFDDDDCLEDMEHDDGLKCVLDIEDDDFHFLSILVENPSWKKMDSPLEL